MKKTFSELIDALGQPILIGWFALMPVVVFAEPFLAGTA